MKNIVQNKTFWLGFGLGMVASVGLNYASYLYNVCPDGIDDCGWGFGFPIPFYTKGGFISYTEVAWIALIADIFFALTVSFVLGWVLTRVFTEKG